MDIKVVLANGQVYAATAFSLKYIKVHFHRYGEGYFWKKDMLIVSDIRRRTLKKAVEKAQQENYFDQIFSHIGHADNVFGSEYRFTPEP